MSRLLRYTIEGEDRFLSISLEFTPQRVGPQEIHLPIWRPGRYQAQYFAKNIAGITSSRGLIRKSGLSTWTLTIDSLDPVVLSYRYFADQPDAGGCVSQSDLLYINFIACLIFPHRGENRPCEVNISLPFSTLPFSIPPAIPTPAISIPPAISTLPGYRITACSLTTYGSGFRAKSYRELVDSPFIAAPEIFSYSWKSHGVQFFIEGVGPQQHFSKRLLQAYERFVDFQIGYMEGFPGKKYHFLHWICPKPFYHGVEHTASTMMVMGPEDRDSYDDLIGLASHELFHVWNVATIRPKELLPYDYTRAVIFDTGWVIEGITTYLGDWFLWASGVVTADEYVGMLLGNLKLHFERDGESKQSLVESSIDLWLDGYGQALPGKRVSIYFKGALVALALDLMIRQKFNHQRSLRDVLLAMKAEFKKGYTRTDFYALVENVYEAPLSDFWRIWVEGNEPLGKRIGELMVFVGLSFKESPMQLEIQNAALLASFALANSQKQNI
jgi:predicted metalloprotease with PDZ domain